MNHSLGLTIETLVAILMMVTISYCMLLNSRLKRLRADEHSLKATIGELITATEIAERAIGVDGPIREYYLVPFTEPDLSRHRTEICWPVFQTA